jgi:putative sterol carrier protein
LIDGLPGISRNLLTERVRALEAEGILVRRDLPPPAARQVYELTDDGHALAAAMVPLVGWGAKRLGDPVTDESFHARWAAVAMAGFADREAAKGVDETYQYVIGDAAFYFTVRDGSIRLHDGRAENAAVVLTTDDQTWAEIAFGKISASSAASAGALTVTGDPQAAKRLGNIFSRRQLLGVMEAA